MDPQGISVAWLKNKVVSQHMSYRIFDKKDRTVLYKLQPSYAREQVLPNGLAPGSVARLFNARTSSLAFHVTIGAGGALSMVCAKSGTSLAHLAVLSTSYCLNGKPLRSCALSVHPEANVPLIAAVSLLLEELLDRAVASTYGKPGVQLKDRDLELAQHTQRMGDALSHMSPTPHTQSVFGDQCTNYTSLSNPRSHCTLQVGRQQAVAEGGPRSQTSWTERGARGGEVSPSRTPRSPKWVGGGPPGGEGTVGLPDLGK